MTERRSAGILLFRRPAGRLEVLLAHPGGPYFAKKDLGDWTIPKGEPDPGEDAADLLRVARREFEEETGLALDPAAPTLALGSIVQNGGKVVHAWAVEGDLDPATATSNTFEFEWPPRSGRLASFPEIDRVAWYPPDEARRRIKATQAPLIDRLEAALAGPSPPDPGPDLSPGWRSPTAAGRTFAHRRPASRPSGRRSGSGTSS